MPVYHRPENYQPARPASSRPKAPLWRKLVGYGPGMMHQAVEAWAGDAMTPRMATFYAAHNEYLEQLLSTGILGLAAWLAFVVSSLRRGQANPSY